MIRLLPVVMMGVYGCDETDKSDYIVRIPEEDMSCWLGRVLRSFAFFACVAGVMPTNVQAQGQGRRNAGAQVFSSNCAGCHGADGRGAERGPSIATMPSVISKSDDDLLGIVTKGVPGTGMPSFSSLDEVSRMAVVQYLRTLQGRDKTAAPVTGDAEAGRALFYGKAQCSNCHMVQGQGGFIGSDLTAYGLSHPAAAIHTAIVDPDSVLQPNAMVMDVVTKKGQKVSGIVRTEDNFSLVVQSIDGRFHMFSKSDLASTHSTGHSLMPRDYGTTLTSKEQDDLSSFLIVTAQKIPASERPATGGRRRQ
jgi:cytochrome c oxidase cbb3-type subunit 3